MDGETFRSFQRIAYERAGIFLRAGKVALVQARLAGRLRDLGLRSEREYLARLEASAEGGGEELVRFLDAISTNFTSFFREPDHFDTLREWVESLRAGGQRRFRLWSAGCSSGEEPFTAAMVLDGPLQGCDWKILATDLSTRVLARAAEGVYTGKEIEAVPAAFRRYLVPAGSGEGGAGRHAIAPRLRERVLFQRLNLVEHPYPIAGPLDAVFCRNVMIYFDRPARAALVADLERLLGPGAPLFVGHAETLSGIATRLRGDGPSVYRAPAGSER